MNRQPSTENGTTSKIKGIDMGVKKKIKYWIDTAHYDLVSAKAMLDKKRFLYEGQESFTRG